VLSVVYYRYSSLVVPTKEHKFNISGTRYIDQHNKHLPKIRQTWQKCELSWYLRERGSFTLGSAIDGNKAGRTDIKRIVLVIVELVLIHRVLVARLQDFPTTSTSVLQIWYRKLKVFLYSNLRQYYFSETGSSHRNQTI
jgi:hypothetical protein